MIPILKLRMSLYTVTWLSLLSPSWAHSSSAAPENTLSQFILIEDKNRQAEAWALCSASYTALSQILEKTDPATSKELSQLSNGAQMAVGMTFVAALSLDDSLDDGNAKQKFDASWRYAKIAMESMPDAQKVSLMARLERADTSEKISDFLEDLSQTVETCIGNSQGQQMYIDMWRDLATSGLLDFQQ